MQKRQKDFSDRQFLLAVIPLSLPSPRGIYLSNRHAILTFNTLQISLYVTPYKYTSAQEEETTYVAAAHSVTNCRLGSHSVHISTSYYYQFKSKSDEIIALIITLPLLH